MLTSKPSNRRTFIQKAACGLVGTALIPEIVSATIKNESAPRISLKNGSTILFQGDSITDSGRNKNESGYNSSSALGNGYATLAAAGLLLGHADKGLKIYNKGISGNKVHQLAERWNKDCLEIKPDLLSILIGVNDFWHTLSSGYQGTIKNYRNDYKALLDRTLQQLPDVQLVIGEPFAIRGVKAVDEKWYPAFDEYRMAAKEIAEAYKAIWIPYQAVFDKAMKHAPGVYWTPDGVHPSLAGASLMAEAWLKTIKG